MKNNKQPELRFPGFTEDWEQRRFADLFNRVKSYSLSRDAETKEETGVCYVHYGDIHTKVADKIDNQSKIPNINQGNFETLQQGDLILADASEDYQGIATPAVILESTRFDIVSGLHTIALRPKDANPLYLYYLINSEVFRKYGYRVGTGMKVFGISATNVLKFETLFPSYNEQKKVSAFFKQLDDTIALHQQELTALKETKQGFLQKMFPKEGEKVPEIRFPGFTEDWEQHKLREVLKVNSGRDYKHLNQGSIPVYGTGGYMLSVDDKLSEIDGIGIGRKGTIDKPQYLKAPYWTVDTLFYMTSFENNDLLFLLTVSQKINWKRMDESTGVPSLSKTVIENVIQYFPVYDEQIKIGKFFKQLDETITLHQRELDLLKETKKAFLQKMFV